LVFHRPAAALRVLCFYNNNDRKRQRRTIVLALIQVGRKSDTL